MDYNKFLPFALFPGILLLGGCISMKNMTIDQNASKSTQMLFYNLDKLAEEHVIFGHQHATMLRNMDMVGGETKTGQM